MSDLDFSRAEADAPRPRDVRSVLTAATDILGHAGVTSSDVDATLLLAHVLGVSRGELAAMAMRGGDLSDEQQASFDAVLARRAAREPLQHLTGTAPFRHLDLQVGPGVFVPRPETEMVAQLAIDALRAVASPEPIAVDLGTGSGALALALATEVPHAQIFALEKMDAAFAWASRNFSAVAAPNAQLHQGDLAEAFPELGGQVSVLVSNPPYVPDGAIPRDPEVRDWDPPTALYGGEDGLDLVRVLSGVGLRLVHSGGTIVIEHGEWQGEPIREILAGDGWLSAATHPDLTTRDRATTATRP